MGKNRELDFSGFPPGTITEYTTLICLACIFDIFTKQIGLAPRSAYSEIKRYIRGDGGQVILSNGKALDVSKRKKEAS